MSDHEFLVMEARRIIRQFIQLPVGDMRFVNLCNRWLAADEALRQGTPDPVLMAALHKGVIRKRGKLAPPVEPDTHRPPADKKN